jgi:hypothetical protein
MQRVVEAVVDDQRGRLTARLERAHALELYDFARVRAARGATRGNVERVAARVVRLVHDAVGGLITRVVRAIQVVGRRGRRTGCALSGDAVLDPVAERAVVALCVRGAVAARAIGFAAVARHVVAVVAFLVAFDDLVAAERSGVGIRLRIGLAVVSGIDLGFGGVHVRGCVRRILSRGFAVAFVAAASHGH